MVLTFLRPTFSCIFFPLRAVFSKISAVFSKISAVFFKISAVFFKIRELFPNIILLFCSTTKKRKKVGRRRKGSAALPSYMWRRGALLDLTHLPFQHSQAFKLVSEQPQQQWARWRWREKNTIRFDRVYFSFHLLLWQMLYWWVIILRRYHWLNLFNNIRAFFFVNISTCGLSSLN